MKQTAVQWLEFEINRRGPKEDNPPQWLKELYEQAKEMEKEQMWQYIKNYYVNGENSLLFHKNEFEQYYNKTFKKTEQ